MSQTVQAILQEDQQFQLERDQLAAAAQKKIQKKKDALEKELLALQKERNALQVATKDTHSDSNSAHLQTTIEKKKQAIKQNLAENSKQVSQAIKAILPN